MTTITAINKVQVATLAHGTDDYNTISDDFDTATDDDDQQDFCKEGE